MVSLGVDTSTPAGSVAVLDSERLLGELNLVGGGHHQGRLLRSIDLLLDLAGLDVSGVNLLAVALGPGTFTGLRVGIATVKGIALALEIPAFGVSTLLAMGHRYLHRGLPVVPLIDAGRGEVYAALYRKGDGGILVGAPERSADPERLVASLPEEPVLFCGDGVRVCWSLIRSSRGRKDSLEEGPCFLGAVLAQWGVQEHKKGSPWSLRSLTPNYIRPPDAELGRRS